GVASLLAWRQRTIRWPRLMLGRRSGLDIRLKRAYEQADADDGRRILVDGLWPRGISKQRAAIDDWLRELAPSQGLRQWFDHDIGKWNTFRRRYRAQLETRARRAALDRLRRHAEAGRITLVYAARDTEHNN